MPQAWAVSPDRKHLVYRTGDAATGKTVLLDLVTGAKKTVTLGPTPIFASQIFALDDGAIVMSGTQQHGAERVDLVGWDGSMRDRLESEMFHGDANFTAIDHATKLVAMQIDSFTGDRIRMFRSAANGATESFTSAPFEDMDYLDVKRSMITPDGAEVLFWEERTPRNYRLRFAADAKIALASQERGKPIASTHDGRFMLSYGDATDKVVGRLARIDLKTGARYLISKDPIATGNISRFAEDLTGESPVALLNDGDTVYFGTTGYGSLNQGLKIWKCAWKEAEPKPVLLASTEGEGIGIPDGDWFVEWPTGSTLDAPPSLLQLTPDKTHLVYQTFLNRRGAVRAVRVDGTKPEQVLGTISAYVANLVFGGAATVAFQNVSGADKDGMLIADLHAGTTALVPWDRERWTPSNVGYALSRDGAFFFKTSSVKTATPLDPHACPPVAVLASKAGASYEEVYASTKDRVQEPGVCIVSSPELIVPFGSSGALFFERRGNQVDLIHITP